MKKCKAYFIYFVIGCVRSLSAVSASIVASVATTGQGLAGFIQQPLQISLVYFTSSNSSSRVV